MNRHFQPWLTILLLACATPGASAGAIVASRTSPLPSLNADEAPSVFVGLQRSVQGHTITVLFQRSGPTREEFNTKVLGRTGPELSSYLAALIFTGRIVAPVELANDEQVKQAVIANPNAVGYISDGAVDDSVKVLLRY